MKTEYKREYTAAWVAVFISGVTAEIIGLDNRFWLPWLLVFGAIEAAALGLKRLKGTASAHVWWWNGGKVGRALQTGSLGVWLSWHIFALNPSIGLGIFCAGLAVWLVPHFYTRGATG